MDIPCRLDLHVTCCGEDYFKSGGKDCRTSLPSALKEIRKLVEHLFFCGRPVPTLYWDAGTFVTELSGKHKQLAPSIPCESTALWEFHYIVIPCEKKQNAYFMADAFLARFIPEIGKVLRGFGIDPNAYRFSVKAWDLDVPPDDSAEHDFLDGEEYLDPMSGWTDPGDRDDAG